MAVLHTESHFCRVILVIVLIAFRLQNTQGNNVVTISGNSTENTMTPVAIRESNMSSEPSTSSTPEQSTEESNTTQSTVEPTSSVDDFTTEGTTVTDGPQEKTGFNTVDWAVIGVASGIPLVAFIITIIWGICRVTLDESKLKKKMQQLERQPDSDGQPFAYDNPAFN